MRMVIEGSILSSMRRPGGYGSSMHGLNMHMGRYEELDFFDILNDPYMTPDMEKEDVNTRMERLYQVRSWELKLLSGTKVKFH